MKMCLKSCFFIPLLSCNLLSTNAAVVLNPSVSGLNDRLGGGMYIDPITGYDFTPTRPYQVDYLGVYDDASNGLYAEHVVGLFIRQTGERIAFTTIDNTGFLEGTIRWKRISHVLLVPGVVYNISSYNWAEDRIYANFAVNVQVSPDITSVQGYIEGAQSDFHMPTRQGGPATIFLGPAFGTAVPEPYTVSLLFLSSFALMTGRYLRMK